MIAISMFLTVSGLIMSYFGSYVGVALLGLGLAINIIGIAVIIFKITTIKDPVYKSSMALHIGNIAVGTIGFILVLHRIPSAV